MNSFIMHDCPADIILTIGVLTYQGKENQITLLLNTSDDWGENLKMDDLQKTFGVIPGRFIKAMLDDREAVGYKLQKYKIIDGRPISTMKSDFFFKLGSRFRRSHVDSDGCIQVYPEDRI